MPFAPLPAERPAFLFGPSGIVEGYYDLEDFERNRMNDTITRHSDAVRLWYRALTLYRRGMLGGWEFEGEAGTPELAAAGLQSQLLGLGVTSMKAALDMLLAGYYSVAFGTIRHMLETFAQCIYVRFRPEEARLWYELEGGIEAQPDPPGMWRICQAILAVPDIEGTNLAELIEESYRCWRLMCKGAHPSGVGIRQTVGEDEGQFVIAATYHRHLALAGFDVGLFAAVRLLPQALVWAKPEVGEMSAEWEALNRQVMAWRAAHEEELLAAEGNEALFPEVAPEQGEAATQAV